MECLQSRIDSFSRPVKVQNSANTGPVKKLKWPHPPSFTANPLSLAEAGFYFDPSYDERDNVTCFVCGKELAGWEDHDDPFDIHWKKSAKTCPWAVVRCALKADLDSSGRFAFSDKNRLPSSKLLEKARLQVFDVGDGWVHDRVRNHGASSKRMAKAGFLFTPQHPDDDSATCLYCNLSLNEWDSTDDPLDEHRKRKGTVCPFFIGSVSSPNVPATSSLTRSTRSSSAKSSSHISTTTTTRGRGRPVMPDVVQDTIKPLAPPAEAGPSRKQSKKVSRSRSRKTLHEEPEDDDEQADEEYQQPKRKSRASTRSLSRSVSRKKDPSSRKKKTVPTVSEEKEPDENTLTGSAIIRSRSRKSNKSTVAQPLDTDGHETKHDALRKSKKSSRTGSRSKLVPSLSLEGYATAPEEVFEDGDDDLHGEEEDSSFVLIYENPSSRLVTKSKTPKNALVAEANEVEEQQVLVTSKTRKTSTSSERSTTTVREKKNTTTEMADGVGVGEQETLTSMNSEDEIKAVLEDVQLDDTETDDHIAEGAPQELDVIDEEVISFAPRLVTQPFSEAEQAQQRQRPRTPNLVPFMEMAGRVSSPDRLGSEEKMSEVEPKTPPRKFVDDEGDPAPLVPSANNLTNPGVDAAEVERPPLQSESGQAEEKSHHYHHDRTLQQEQEPLKTEQPQVEPQFMPFLSKLPFVPLHVLTEAELDMTVEDWIRYQMEVEYDKFKRDGERELMRFKKKAEETRRIIEGL